MTAPTHDPVIETKTCLHCSSTFDITQGDLDFYAKISPKFGDYVAEIPTPTLCPDCRQRRRLAFRNERHLYRRICDASQQPIISIYSPNKPYKVYDQKIWRSDARDPLDYGRDFDFSRTFTEQFEELMREVPRRGLINTDTAINSPFTNFSDSGKNIYMCSDTYGCSDVMYSHTIKDLSYCVDVLDLIRSEECYYCSFSTDLYDCTYVTFSQSCSQSQHLSYCVGVKYSSYCVGLENVTYHILNKSYTKEEYIEKINNMSQSELLEQYEILYNEYGKPPRIINCENVQGNHLENCQNCCEVYFAQGVTNSKYVYIGYDMDQCMDTTIHNIECYLDYEASSGGKLKHSAFNSLGWGGNHIYYTQECVDSSHLFGCIGLRNKEYCVFNRQYTKEEYNELVPKIIEHMKQTGERGEFFHPSLSPFGYNETVAAEYYPVQKAESGKLEAVSSDGKALGLELSAYGYKRSDYEAPQPQVDKIIPGEKLPDYGCATIQEKKPEFLSDILRYAIRCEVSGKLFRLIPQEIEFYKKHNLSLPRKHPDVRHAERMEMRK